MSGCGNNQISLKWSHIIIPKEKHDMETTKMCRQQRDMHVWGDGMMAVKLTVTPSCH